MQFQSICGENFSEKTIEKSRFLAYASRTEGEEAARAFLEKIRGMHPQATHVCFGYVSDKLGNEQRFSDDGEPQGTAGMPILNVLKAKNLCETAVAVVRYFGGIKLGAGGLTRAYAGSASDVLETASIRMYAMGVEITLEVGYPDVNAAIRFLEGEKVLKRDFQNAASFTVIVKEEEAETFKARALDFFNGRAVFREGDRYYFPF